MSGRIWKVFSHLGKAQEMQDDRKSGVQEALPCMYVRMPLKV